MITLHCRPTGAAPTVVHVGRDLLAGVPTAVGARAAFLYCDPGAPGAAAFGPWPRRAHEGGELGKTLAACEDLLVDMLAAGLDRNGLLLAMGGGVVGDVGGLAAALFLRGIEVWQLPTTLLAMVDSSVGGKTAVNLPAGKNLVGVVHPPARVYADIDTLATLPQFEFRSGLAEVVKMAIGCDAELFELLERERERVHRREPTLLTDLVARAVAAKIAVVEADPFERGGRRVLNLGHTLGHALEAHSGYRLPHGLAVARGLHFALAVAVEVGALDRRAATRARDLLLAYGFAREALPPPEALRPFLVRDKKMAAGRVHFATPTGIGTCDVQPLSVDALLAMTKLDEA